LIAIKSKENYTNVTNFYMKNTF